MNSLKTNVEAKKNKNVDIFLISEEVCILDGDLWQDCAHVNTSPCCLRSCFSKRLLESLEFLESPKSLGKPGVPKRS